jgi:hypothetical protein
MSIEDVVLVSTVREDIRGRTLRVNAAEIPLRVEAEQLGALGLEIPDYLRFPKSEASSPLYLQRGMDGAHEICEDAGERLVSLGLQSVTESSYTVKPTIGCRQRKRYENANVFEGESTQPMENNQGEVISTRAVETVPETLMTNNIGTQQGDAEMEEGEGMAIGTSTPNLKPPVAPQTRSFQVYPRWLVGRGPLYQPYFLPIPWEGESPCHLARFFLGVQSAIITL